MTDRAGLACLLVRNLTNLVAALTSFLDPDITRQPLAVPVLVLIAAWSGYRLATRSQSRAVVLADFVLTVAVAASITFCVAPDRVLDGMTAPEVVTAVAVATLAVQAGPLLSLPMTIVIAAAYAWSAAQVVGWPAVSRVTDLYDLLAVWVAASLMRTMGWHLAAAVDRARADRQTAEVARNVAAARRNYDREQLALLHDTAAATLLMVGQGASVSRDRLSAQALRDLQALKSATWTAPPTPVDIVAALRAETAYLQTPVRITGAAEVWLRGRLAAAIVSAVREVLNNVDRHARATAIHIQVRPDQLTVTDDGIGFDVDGATGGHGIRASVIARMNRAGGAGQVLSTPTAGTVAVLSWPDPSSADHAEHSSPATERLIGRIRTVFALALIGYAVTAALTAFPPISSFSRFGPVQVGLAILTVLCTLTAVPAIFSDDQRPGRIGVALLCAIALVQPALLRPAELAVDANWSPAVIGFCLVPLMLRWPTRIAAITLICCWLLPALINLIRDSTQSMVVFLGLSAAGNLIPQLFAAVFSSWAFGAARLARREIDDRLEVDTAERVSEAIQSDYLRHYADVMADVTELLQLLSGDEPVTAEIRRRARAESRRLRALFDQHRVDHPLMFELRTLIDAAEARGVEVAAHYDGEFPALDDAQIDRIVAVAAALLHRAQSPLRVVATAAGAEVTVSVVADVPGHNADDDLGIDLSDDVELVWSGDTAWLLIRSAQPTIRPAAARS